MRKYTKYVESVDGVDCELMHEAIEGTFLKARVTDKLVIGYLVCDDDYRDDCLDDDYCGQMVSFHRDNRKQHSKGFDALGLDSEGSRDLETVYRRHMREADKRYVEEAFKAFQLEEHLRAFGPEGAWEFDQMHDETDEAFVCRALMTDAEHHDWCDVIHYDIYEHVLEEMWALPEFFPGNPDAQLLSVYSHSGEHWSLLGGGMQCAFDTANGAGVWIPGEYISKELEGIADQSERRTKARAYAQGFLDTYNEINAGQVFGVVVAWYDENGDLIDSDSCWGCIGSEYAGQELKDTFDNMCRTIQKDHEEDVHTQCGAQLELI